MSARYSLGRSGVKALRRAAQEEGASEGELAAIERLEAGRGERVDVERLEALAWLAGLDWRELYPELAS